MDFTLTNVLFVLVCLSVAVVIFWRRSDDWMALLGSLMLVTFGIATFSGSLDSLVASYPTLQPINGFINFCGAASLLLFFYLFPSGHFEPRGHVGWRFCSWGLVFVRPDPEVCQRVTMVPGHFLFL